MSYGLSLGELALFILALAALAVYGAWVARDASRRGKPPLLVLLLVLFFSPFGLIAWFLFRPPVVQHLSHKG
jgi:hypothetical protein